MLPQQKEKDRSNDLHLYTNKTPRTFDTLRTLPDLQATTAIGLDRDQLERSLPTYCLKIDQELKL